jgi:RNA polymerase sigma factor (sigma-70 family)
LNQRDKIFTDIISSNHGSIYRICLAYLYDRSHAADLYQEILLQIWNSLDSYKGKAQVSTWIYRIAVNTAITYNKQYTRSRYEELPDTADLIADAGHSKEQEARLAQLHLAISQLDTNDRLIISLVLEDLSYKEIAEITGSNTNNIGVRITRIKARLLKLMNDKNNNDGL